MSVKRPIRKQIPAILVVCEDENIEPAYFNKLKEVFSNILTIEGNKKTNPVNIVKRAIKEKIKLINQRKIIPHPQTWCVFDVDSNSQEKINEALKLAKDNEINIALSNPCIEVWFLCHYAETTKPYKSSKEAFQELQKYCSTYNKTIMKNADIDEFLNYVTDKKTIEIALINADKINQPHKNPDKYNISRNPSSNITELIKQIISED